MNRRTHLKAISSGAVLAAVPQAVQAAAGAADERSFRHRIETVDALFDRARGIRSQGGLAPGPYRVLLEILHAEEAVIATQARAYRFEDLTESNY